MLKRLSASSRTCYALSRFYSKGSGVCVLGLELCLFFLCVESVCFVCTAYRLTKGVVLFLSYVVLCITTRNSGFLFWNRSVWVRSRDGIRFDPRSAPGVLLSGG